MVVWRLNVSQGRQWWTVDHAADSAVEAEFEQARDVYHEKRYQKKHSSDQLLRILADHGLLRNGTEGQRPEVPDELKHDPVSSSLHKAVAYYATLQTEDGHWSGDYGGPMFLMPGFVIATYVTRTPIDAHVRAEMIRYLRNHQNEDGGFGLHIEHHSTMFGTATNYISMRLLGVEADDPQSIKARQWILNNDGAEGCASWGKFWMCVLGVYDWDGIDPLIPEFWLLPYALPIHPARFWCHCRAVYLPMSHLYGLRATGEITPLVKQIRSEIYTQPYEDINWGKLRGHCCPKDVYAIRPRLQRVLWDALTLYEKIWFPGKDWLRRQALNETMLLIKAEDESTNYIDIGPVNKTIDFICQWFDDPNSEAVAKHRDRLKDYLWLAEDGMKMQGYNGSQLWDTAFSAQAILSIERPIIEPFVKTLSLAHDYVEITQVLEDVPNRERYYRHSSYGAWPFSTLHHGWPIADCTGEGLAAALMLQAGTSSWIPKKKLITEERLQAAAQMILGYQNKDGGWATYELKRAPAWVEFFNPSEVFGDIMIDYSYVECSASALKGLGEFRQAYPDNPLRPSIDAAIGKGLKYIESIQRDDGSWYGSWGVCFLYAIWFAVDAYTSMGLTLESSPSMRRACQFVLGKQREDGSWGESYLSSETKVYTQSKNGLVVSTAWALLLLSLAKWPEREPLERAARFLTDSQDENGDWPQQTIAGVFNKNCMISYSQYRNIFPIWALAQYHSYKKSCQQE